MNERLESAEPMVTERDLTLLLMNEDSLVTLGAVLGLRARTVPGDPFPVGLDETKPS